MIFFGKFKLLIEVNINGIVETIPVHYTRPNKKDLTKLLKAKEAKEAKKVKEDENTKESETDEATIIYAIDILDKFCDFDDEKVKKRFYEIAELEPDMMLLELNTAENRVKSGKQKKSWNTSNIESQKKKQTKS